MNVGISTPEASEIGLNVYPNPVADKTIISFIIAKPEKVHAEVYNAYGVRVATVTHSFFQKGEHQLHWKAEGLGAGMYIIKVSVGDNLYSTKLIKTDR